MKIAVLSDIHGAFDKALAIFNKEEPDRVIFAGDGLKDAIELSYAVEDKTNEFVMVRGNMDYENTRVPHIAVVEEKGWKIMVTHGHMYGVKESMDNLGKAAMFEKVEIVIFGHTHRPTKYKENGIHYFNPGAVKDGAYGIIRIEEEEVFFEHKSI